MRPMRFVCALLIAAGAGARPRMRGASAQDYPTRQVKIVIAFSPAGAIDILGRFIADKLSQMWGQSVIVENRPGGSGNIGAAAASDRGARRLHAALRRADARRQRDALADHGVRSGRRASSRSCWWRPRVEVFQVSAMTPFKSVQEVIDYAKANPGKLNYYSVGIGSTSHLSTVLFMDVTGTKMQHVPYSQMSQGMSDLMSGRTEINFGPMGSSIANIRSGKMRALALNGPVRSKLLPDVPTLDGGRHQDGARSSSWYGFFAPKGTPKPIIDKINRDLQTVIDMPEMREREAQLGYRYFGGPPERLAAYVKDDIAKWQTLEKKGAFK